MSLIHLEYKYLRPYKARVINEMTEALVDKSSKLYVNQYFDCTIVPHYFKPNIDKVSTDLPEYVSEGAKLYQGNFLNVKTIKGTVLYCGYYRPHWGHFLVNTMSRIWYYFNTRLKIDKIIFFSDSSNINIGNDNLKMFLELAGIADLVEIINTPVHFEHIIEPECALVRFSHYSKEYMDVIYKVRDNALKINLGKEYPDKIFLTRSQLPKSMVNEINIEYLDDFFKNNGYTILSPEKMTIIELIHYFNHATTIASICGTLAHNLVFAPIYAKIIIIERHPFINISQQMCDKAAGINPILIDAHQMPLQSSSIGSLFLYNATLQLECFIKDHKLKTHHFPNDDNAKKNELVRFIKRHRSLYGYAPIYHNFDLKYGAIYTEAVLESYKEYGKWLSRKAPLMVRDYFSLRSYPNLIKLFKSAYFFLRRILKHQ